MKFISLNIKQGLFIDKFDFFDGVNIIYSEKNSVGKTTLLRFLIYSLGYAIPNLKGVFFERCELDLEIEDNTKILCHIIRNKHSIVLKREDHEFNYSLPYDLNELHTKIFGIQNNEVLDNLLGTYYLDQEKGWTLLNRGKVIGKIPFNIERLIRGLSDRSCQDLENQLSSIERELKKYKQMFDIAQYQVELKKRGENIAFDTPTEEIEKELDVLYNERQPVSEELDRIKNVIRKNIDFKKYITSFRLVVEDKEGHRIPVNEDTLVDFRDTTEYLIAKRKIVHNQFVEIDRKIKVLEQRRQQQETLFNVQTRIQAFDADVSKMKVDVVTTEKIINQLEKEKKLLDETISRKIKQNNPIIFELYSLIVAYTKELRIEDRYVSPNHDFIFTDDLKSLSGAIFHKIVFSFKISYVKIIDKYTNVKLPIILDSPSGREVDKVNIEDMMKILERDFSDHQILIASIHRYNFDNIHYIELRDRLFHHEPIQSDVDTINKRSDK
jgi:hypothetical protein